MNYIVCREPGSFTLNEGEMPSLKPGHMMLKVKKVGICGTDLHAYTGNQPFFSYPRILGHELGCEVADHNGSQVFSDGDRVAVMPYISCQECIACRRGKTNCCTNISVLGVHSDGGMQEFISVPENIVLAAGDLSYNAIALIEPLAIGAHAIRRAALEKDEFVVVVGCGPIGLGIISLANSIGVKTIAVDMVAERLDFAVAQMGAGFAVQGGADAKKKIEEITNGDFAAAVFDATGNTYALQSGHEYMSHGGRYVLVGLSKDKLSFHHPTIHSKETTLLCSRNATLEDFNWVVDVLSSGAFPVDSFITHQVDYKEMIDQFDHWLDPKNGVIKAMVAF